MSRVLDAWAAKLEESVGELASDAIERVHRMQTENGKFEMAELALLVIAGTDWKALAQELFQIQQNIIAEVRIADGDAEEALELLDKLNFSRERLAN